MSGRRRVGSGERQSRSLEIAAGDEREPERFLGQHAALTRVDRARAARERGFGREVAHRVVVQPARPGGESGHPDKLLAG